MDDRTGFIFYRGFRDSLKYLPEEERLSVYEMICDYALDGIEPVGEGIAMALFIAMKPQIDANNKRYENGKKGGRKPDSDQKETETESNKNQSETKPEPKDNRDITKAEPKGNQDTTKTEPNETETEPKEKDKEKEKEKEKDNVKDKEKVKDIPKSNTHRFTPPTINEVIEYANELNNEFDPQEFYDFYSSKDWYVGKSKMKDWKAAARRARSWGRKSPPNQGNPYMMALQNNFSELQEGFE